MISEKETRFARHFAAFLGERADLRREEKSSFVALLEKLVLAMNEGDSCLVLSHEEREQLAANKLVGVVSGDEQLPNLPLILFGTKLYLHKYFFYEKSLAERIRAMVQGEQKEPEKCYDVPSVSNSNPAGSDLQAQAVLLARRCTLAIVSGGPGTGKTTTAAKIIAGLLELYDGECRIALAAPTGKAAIRLQQSLENIRSSLFGDQEIAGFPEQATTLHRLLGVRRHSTRFRHDSEKPLNVDVVVVDEASMVDLAMMSKLVAALRAGTRLILLGDKDQLASVESGAVLVDMIESLPDNAVILQKTYRFNASIQNLAQAINNGDGERAFTLLQEKQDNTLFMRNKCVISDLEEGYKSYFEAVQRRQYGEYEHVFQIFDQFRVLCASRTGRFGAVAVNRMLEQGLQKKLGSYGLWYPGRPVIITRNDYHHDLFNGDVGICLEDEQGALRVWFPDGSGHWKMLFPAMLPEHESSFAITVHKSQGSEFAEVALVFPEEEMRHLVRELVYTGVTRAKERIGVYAEKERFVAAVSRRTVRRSGLRELLSLTPHEHLVEIDEVDKNTSRLSR